MTSRKPRMVAGVILVALSFASFTLMDTVPDYSPTQNTLHIAGYVFCGMALFLLFRAFRTEK